MTIYANLDSYDTATLSFSDHSISAHAQVFKMLDTAIRGIEVKIKVARKKNLTEMLEREERKLSLMRSQREKLLALTR